MGFLIKNIAILFLILFFSGCSTSRISISPVEDKNPITMYGKNPARNFYEPVALGDSLTLKWEFEVNGSFPSSAVSVYGDNIFVNDLSGRVYAFNFVTGKKSGQLKNSGAVFSSPLIDKNIIIYGVAQSDENKTILNFYDVINSKTVKEKIIEGRIQTEMIKDGSSLFFTTEDGRVYKTSIRGEPDWIIETKSFTHSSPAMFGDVLIFGNDEGEIIGIDNIKGVIKYRKKLGAPFFGGASIVDDTAYLGNDEGKLYSVNILNGDVNWTADLTHRIVMTPAIDDDRIYVGNLGGQLFCLNKSGKILWRIETDGVLNSTPLVTKDKLYQPDLEQRLLIVSKLDGKITKTYPLEGRAKLSPVYSNNLLFIGYDNGIIRAYEISN